MKATAVSLLALFETRTQLEVPLFQRQYIWQREWLPFLAHPPASASGVQR